MLDSKRGLLRVLSQSFPHKAYINLSIPVPALANKANAYLSNFLGVGAFNFFPSPSPLSIKVLIRPAFHLSMNEAITQSKPNERRKCGISSGQRKQFLSRLSSMVRRGAVRWAPDFRLFDQAEEARASSTSPWFDPKTPAVLPLTFFSGYQPPWSNGQGTCRTAFRETNLYHPGFFTNS